MAIKLQYNNMTTSPTTYEKGQSHKPCRTNEGYKPPQSYPHAGGEHEETRRDKDRRPRGRQDARQDRKGSGGLGSSHVLGSQGLPTRCLRRLSIEGIRAS